MQIRRKVNRDYCQDKARYRTPENRSAVFSNRQKTVRNYVRRESAIRPASAKKVRAFRAARQSVYRARHESGGVTIAVLAVLALAVIVYLGLETTTGVCAQWVLNGHEWWCADWSVGWTLFGYPIG